MSGMTFEEVDGRLTPEMRRTLRLVADAHRDATGIRSFRVIRSFAGTKVIGPGFKRDDIDPGALWDLGSLGLVHITRDQHGDEFRVTGDGERFAGWLLTRAGQAVDQVQDHMWHYITGADFAARHPASAQALGEALAVTAVSNPTAAQIRDVGIWLRHALQDVAATADPAGDHEKPADRLETWRHTITIEPRQAAALDALIALTRTVLALDQGAAHIMQTPSRIETVDELRRAVFLTAVTAYEIDRAIQHHR